MDEGFERDNHRDLILHDFVDVFLYRGDSSIRLLRDLLLTHGKQVFFRGSHGSPSGRRGHDEGYGVAKWKYANPDKQNIYTNYSNKIYLELDKPKTMVITNWEFLKGTDNGPIFKCFVEKEDGEDVDKNWAVWDYSLMEALKAKLKGKKPDLAKVEITVLKKGDELEEEFELQ